MESKTKYEARKKWELSIENRLAEMKRMIESHSKETSLPTNCINATKIEIETIAKCFERIEKEAYNKAIDDCNKAFVHHSDVFTHLKKK